MGQTIIVACYLNPSNTIQQLETLLWFINQFRAEGYGVIAAGDFNLTEEQLRGHTQGLKISRNMGPTRRGSNALLAIDHIISTYEMSGVSLLETLSDSDHLPIRVEI